VTNAFAKVAKVSAMILAGHVNIPLSKLFSGALHQPSLEAITIQLSTLECRAEKTKFPSEVQSENVSIFASNLKTKPNFLLVGTYGCKFNLLTCVAMQRS